MVLEWLALEPAIEAKLIMARLRAINPKTYPDNGKLRTLQRRIKQWRVSMARELVAGKLMQEKEDLSPVAAATGERSRTCHDNITRVTLLGEATRPDFLIVAEHRDFYT